MCPLSIYKLQVQVSSGLQGPQCWTATNNSWRFCSFLSLLIFRESSSLRNIATFGILESPTSIFSFCCCFLSASVKTRFSFVVIDQPLSFHGSFLDLFVSTPVNILLLLYPFKMFTTSSILKYNKHHYFQDYTKKLYFLYIIIWKSYHQTWSALSRKKAERFPLICFPVYLFYSWICFCVKPRQKS